MDQLEAEKGELKDAQEKLVSFKAFITEIEASPEKIGTIYSSTADWFRERGIAIPGDTGSGPVDVTADQVRVLVLNLESYINRYSDNSQTLMVLIQDQLGQYNSFTQGSSANIGNANTITQGLARW